MFFVDECVEESELLLFDDESSTVRATTDEDLVSSNEASYEDERDENFDVLISTSR